MATSPVRLTSQLHKSYPNFRTALQRTALAGISHNDGDLEEIWLHHKFLPRGKDLNY